MKKLKELFSSPSVLLPEEASRLMLEVSRGNPAAYKTLYDHYKGPIMSYLMLKLKNQAHAEEIAQEVFLKAYRARETYAPTAQFSSWLFTIAKNTATDFFRKKKEILVSGAESSDSEDSVSYAEQQYANLESDLPSAELQLIERSEQSRLEKCMSELSATQQEALSLRTAGELPYEEIAQSLKLSLPALKSTLFRAKEKLMDCLRKEVC